MGYCKEEEKAAEEMRKKMEAMVPPTPYTLYPTTDTLKLTPYTLHPTPYTLQPTPYTPHLTPHTLHPTPYT